MSNMTAEQFAYWMQGFAELTGDEPPTPAQWKSIREHLQTVFVKVTPPLQTIQQFEPLKTSTPMPWHQMPRVECSVAGGIAAQATC
jgi:hypothetical protein